ncbi:MAG: hypothetical protein IBX68_07930 [Dehalococcoidia bacterium]|nr:hypothetical protein [Dehalococcoidia bacterium]
MEELLLMALLAAAAGGSLVFSFFFLIGLAAFVYVWTNSLPWFRKVSAWAARPVNFIGLVVLIIILFGALVVLLFLLLNSSGIMIFLFASIILLVIGAIALVNFPIALGLINYILRLGRWIYCGYRSWIDSAYGSSRLAVMRAKIKVDTVKDPGIKSKFEDFKDELRQDIQKARRKLSRRADKDD